MASFEDYDEFGNYIGADLDSDDEEEISQPYGQQQREPSAQPLEGFEDEPMEAVEEGALMQVDGACLIPWLPVKASQGAFRTYAQRCCTA